MPNKPPRNKLQFRSSGTPRSAASLLQSITRKVGLESHQKQDLAGELALPDRLRAALPEALRPRLLEVRHRDKELVVFAESAVWAGRLKVAVAEMMEAGPQSGLPELKPDTKLVLRLMPREGFRR
jgi:Dna[CI] antecedent, DciA